MFVAVIFEIVAPMSHWHDSPADIRIVPTLNYAFENCAEFPTAEIHVRVHLHVMSNYIN